MWRCTPRCTFAWNVSHETDTAEFGESTGRCSLPERLCPGGGKAVWVWISDVRMSVRKSIERKKKNESFRMNFIRLASFWFILHLAHVDSWWFLVSIWWARLGCGDSKRFGFFWGVRRFLAFDCAEAKSLPRTDSNPLIVSPPAAWPTCSNRESMKQFSRAILARKGGALFRGMGIPMTILVKLLPVLLCCSFRDRRQRSAGISVGSEEVGAVQVFCVKFCVQVSETRRPRLQRRRRRRRRRRPRRLRPRCFLRWRVRAACCG